MSPSIAGRWSVATCGAPCTVVIALLLAVRWRTGLPATIWIIRDLPIWYLSYSEGFIRRAFVGTFTMPFLVGQPLGEVEIIVSTLGGLACLALLLLLTRLLRQLPRIIGAAFLVSDALPWLAKDLARLDPWVMASTLLAVEATMHEGRFVRGFGCVAPAEPNGSGRNLPIVAAPLCAVVPLIHEAGLWLLLPVLGGILLLRPELRLRAAIGASAAVAAAAGLWFFATTDFSWPADMPLELRNAAQLSSFVTVVLAQLPDLRPSLCRTCVSPAWQILPFSVAPCLIIAAEAWRRAGRRAGIVVGIGILATWAICLFATDTDRLMAWSPIAAVMLVRAAKPS